MSSSRASGSGVMMKSFYALDEMRRFAASAGLEMVAAEECGDDFLEGYYVSLARSG